MASPAYAAQSDRAFDVVLVGGGLQNGLIALALRAVRPELRIALVEREAALGGNHTWCLHAGDVPEAAKSVFGPLVFRRWPGYEVRFPGRTRYVQGTYAAITSERFRAVVSEALASSAGCRVYLGAAARAVEARRVVLDDGTVLSGPLVIDARGPAQVAACGYQKFLGLELRLGRPHGLAHPVLMDATVPQTDGFRFMYVLPLGPRQLLVEDTVFSRTPALDHHAARVAVRQYAEQGYGAIEKVEREECGLLAMPWKGRWSPPAGSPVQAGVRGGYFHPATGYSFPAAVRLAWHLATQAPSAATGPALSRLWREQRVQGRFAERLNWMLFHCFEPAQMWRVFARFYGLPAPLIQRFYAMKLTRGDRVRILLGRPPPGMSLRRALSLQKTR